MKSLVLKDLIMLKNYARTLLIMIAFFTIVTFTNDDVSFLSGMIILILAMVPITSFSYDQNSKWDLFSQTLPVSRKQLVCSKYILGLIAIGSGTLLALLLNITMLSFKKLAINTSELVGVNMMIACVSILYLSIIIPLVYQFGVERSRLISIAVLAVPSLLFVGLTEIGVSFSFLDAMSLGVLVGISSLITVCVLFISVSVSVHIYSRKDF